MPTVKFVAASEFVGELRFGSKPLLEQLGCQTHSRIVESFLSPTCTPVTLQTGTPTSHASGIERWRVLDKVGLLGRAS